MPVEQEIGTHEAATQMDAIVAGVREHHDLNETVQFDDSDPSGEENMHHLIRRLEVMLGTGEDLSPYRDAEYVDEEFVQYVIQGGYSIEAASGLIDAIRRCEVAFSGENQGEATQLLSIVEAIPSELLQEIYTADSDNKANPITALLNSIPLDGSHAAQLLRILDKCQDEDISTVDALTYPEYMRLFAAMESNERDFELARIPSHPESTSYEAIADFNQRVVNRVYWLMGEQLGLPMHIVDAYIANARFRHTHLMPNGSELPTAFEGDRIADDIYGIAACVEAVSIDDFKRLDEAFTLETPEIYRPEDLRIMRGILDEDETTLEGLRRGDLTVVFFDARGDIRSEIIDTIAAYRKRSKRVLFFEMSNGAVIEERKKQLLQRDLHPSTVTFDTHGASGSLKVNRGKDTYRIVSERSAARTRRDVFVGDLVDELMSDGFMQPNRGIDSADEAIGTIEIFFSACSSDEGNEATRGSALRRSIARAAVDAASSWGTKARIYGSRSRMSVTWGGGAIRYVNLDPLKHTDGEQSAMTRYTFDPNHFADEGIALEHIDGVVHDRRAA
ncbi:hypothetical protein IPP92_03055 [Candidatus Saccharibacteria bacterium]|nr:MAG: hypothetical protein IPP92_03055 [Candidatus Saccharibacteria bacterium]